MFQGFSASREWRDAATSLLPPSSCPHIGPGLSLALPHGRTLLHLAWAASLWAGAVPLHSAWSGGGCLHAALHDSGPCTCPWVLGGFKGRVLLPLSHTLPSYLQHTAACPVCRGCPMPGAGGGSCSLLGPAVVLLLSKVTSSRAWTELGGEGGVQLFHFHALGKYGSPLYLPYEGPESTSPLAQCLKCCCPGCREG